MYKAQKPPFITPNLGSAKLSAPPYSLLETKMAVFALKTDVSKLKTLCDTFLNDPIANQQMRYEPLLPYVLLSLADSENWGRQVTFWVLTHALKRNRAGEYVSDHLAWFSPYLFDDEPDSLALKEEVYGFPSVLTHLEPENIAITNPEFSLTLKHLPPELEGQALLQTQRVGDDPLPESPSIWQSWDEAILAIITTFLEGEDGPHLSAGLDEADNPLAVLRDTSQQVVHLKQVRDVEDSTRASYQAVIESPLNVTAFHGGGPLHQPYRLEFSPNHPLAETLGLASDQVETVGGWWFKLDLSLNAGQERYRAISAPQKLAVLGGGLGSLASVFELTNEPGWQNKYDITVYQLGWRLGGKAASGRNQAIANRVEEGTGLHFFLGFYNNIFRLVQECYAELGRPANAPFATWQDAFYQRDFIVIEEYIHNRWEHWQLFIPPNDKVPGQTHTPFTPWDYVKEILALLVDNFSRAFLPSLEAHLVQDVRLVHKILDVFEQVAGKLGVDFAHSKGLSLLDELLKAALIQLGSLNDDPTNHFRRQHGLLSELLKAFLKALEFMVEVIVAPLTELRRLWLLFELGLINLIGIIDDGVLTGGFSVINDQDYREWLVKHGATKRVACSAPVRAVYSVYGAYPKGDTGPNNPTCSGDIAAGTTLHAALLTVFAYRGSVIWNMKAPVGDVLIAPLYQVLQQRGVKFKFFHNVKELRPNAAGTAIDEIIVGEQVTLKPGLERYNPLINVKGLPCWPSEPLYAQLEQGQALKASKANLESYWRAWPDVNPEISLKQGEDFDLVLLGIAVGALKEICAPLLDPEQNPKTWQAWQNMVEKVQTVQTQSLQLWLKPTLQGLGWPLASPALGSYADPFSALLDETPLTPTETWPPNHIPQLASYFAAPLQDADPIPPPSDHTFPEKEWLRVRQASIDWLNEHIRHLWPTSLKNGQFNYDLLIDINEAQGEARFEAQYWVANINPSDRYVLAVKNSDQYRLKPDGSGFDNLYLVGDWVDNGHLNLGSTEPTVIAGLEAARAISGWARPILGIWPQDME